MNVLKWVQVRWTERKCTQNLRNLDVRATASEQLFIGTVQHRTDHVIRIIPQNIAYFFESARRCVLADSSISWIVKTVTVKFAYEQEICVRSVFANEHSPAVGCDILEIVNQRHLVGRVNSRYHDASVGIDEPESGQSPSSSHYSNKYSVV